ncbi:MAG: hypothetical protein PHH02_00200 [Dehalococcoidales bacterium]|jgi:hypothetical protein|nr:hypothetical protein [Dehalococcoidales bacterium]MDD4322101.1 hypothetical protein [Dehalococcoidales bacterium]
MSARRFGLHHFYDGEYIAPKSWWRKKAEARDYPHRKKPCHNQRLFGQQSPDMPNLTGDTRKK